MTAKDDFLAPLPVNDVANWYYRAAEFAAKEKIKGQVPLASVLLKKYLNNRNGKTLYRFSPPSYLTSLDQVTDTLRYHRDVFLTKKKARLGKKGLEREIWAGIRPRLQGKSPFQKWDVGTDPKVYIEYQSLVEIGKNRLDIGRIQIRGTKDEKDIFASLRGFQLMSRVIVTGKLLSESKVKVHFSFWQCEIIDRYDFDYTEHLSFKNPDYGRHNDPKAVRPQSKWLKVYHTNAKRLEDAKLASPYQIHSYSWIVQDPEITGPAEITF